jgi:hypothetical protein
MDPIPAFSRSAAEEHSGTLNRRKRARRSKDGSMRQVIKEQTRQLQSLLELR